MESATVTDRETGPDVRPPRRRWTVLAATMGAFALMLFDGTAITVAVPPIQQDLAATPAAAQWLMSGYALAMGLTLIPAGRVGERFGHRRLFLGGLTGFILASAACSAAASPEQLIAFRIVQGLAAGAINPAVLALIHASFAPAERGRAFAVYGATAGLSSSMGPLVAGALIGGDLGGLGWRPLFLVVNVPVGTAMLLLAARVLPSARGRGGSLDPLGIALLAAALLLITWPLIASHGAEGSAWLLSVLAAAPAAFAVFWRWQLRRERREANPLIDPALVRDRVFAAGVLALLAQFAAFGSLQFVLSVHLQQGVARSAGHTGLALVPIAVGTVVGSTLSRPLVRRLGRRALLAGSGLLLAGTLGTVVTVRAAAGDVDAAALAPATFVAGAGAMLLGTSLITIVLGAATGERAGTAGGMLATATRVGHALGVAVVGAAFFGALPGGAAGAAPGARVAEHVHAMQVAGLTAAALAAVTVALVALLPRRAAPAVVGG